MSIEWGRTREGRIFVGYNPGTEEGGFRVISWAPDWVNLGAITSRHCALTEQTTRVPDEGSEAFERICEAVHDAWWREKIAQGSAAGHPDAKPYEELSESVKEYDRATVRTVLRALAEQGEGGE